MFRPALAPPPAKADDPAWYRTKPSAQRCSGDAVLAGNRNGTTAMSAQTHLFPCLQDNYGVLVHDPATGATASIDAPEAAPVEAALAATGWKLTDILVTHHHGDHTAGIAELKERYHCRVVAPRREAAKIPAVDVEVGEGDRVKVGSLTAEVIETPGHTLGQINYFFPADKLLFAGDTLFS